jgi:enoyl-CoA hydratase/carnithine racemase
MTDTAAPILVTTDAPGTATVTLHRPHRRNAWTVPMQKAYYDALEALRDDPDVRAIVVTGANGSFCPGADTEALSTYSETGTTNPDAASIAQPEWYPATYPKPLIAAVEGMCAGVGLAQALMCDLRISTPGARFTTAFTRRGLPPMHGMDVLLSRVAGPAHATDLLLTGRTFEGADALRLGVVSELSDTPLARALTIAEELAAHCSPTSIATMKDRLSRGWLDRLRESIVEVDAILPNFLGSNDFREGVAGFLERRPPRFAGLPAASATPTTTETPRRES